MKGERWQVVVVANAREGRGRKLLAMRMQGGSVAAAAGGLPWVQLAMPGGDACFPTGLVVDLLPLHVLEVHVVHDHGRGHVAIDPMGLRIVGRLELGDLAPLCAVGMEQACAGMALGGHYALVWACELVPCAVRGEGGRRVQGGVAFGFEGEQLRLPLCDPALLEAAVGGGLRLPPCAALVVGSPRGRFHPALGSRVLAVIG